MNRIRPILILLPLALAGCGPWPGDDDRARSQAQADAGPPDGTIYLTFDDGPIDATAGVLDVLQRHSVRATFFVNGFHLDGLGNENESNAAAMLRRILDEGHVVGNHSYDHMLHNCCDDQGECGAAVCNRLGTWSIGSYRDAERELAAFVPQNVDSIRGRLYQGSEQPAANDRLDRLARLPYTNAWRADELRADCPCCTTDDLPPWDPASTCSADTPSDSARIAMEVADRLADAGFEVFGWDLEWSPESWDGDQPVATLTGADSFADAVIAALSECSAESMTPAHSRAVDFPCDAPRHAGKVVVLTHDFLFEDGPRGPGATLNLYKLEQFLLRLQSLGYRFDTLDAY